MLAVPLLIRLEEAPLMVNTCVPLFIFSTDPGVALNIVLLEFCNVTPRLIVKLPLFEIMEFPFMFNAPDPLMVKLPPASINMLPELKFKLDKVKFPHILSVPPPRFIPFAKVPVAVYQKVCPELMFTPSVAAPLPPLHDPEAGGTRHCAFELAWINSKAKKTRS